MTNTTSPWFIQLNKRKSIVSLQQYNIDSNVL